MHRVLCFGEILWDQLPHGRFIGGAPFNVAYHLARNGCEPLLVSAVGCDALGEEALVRAARAGVDTAGIRRHLTLPTGSATAELDAAGQARFTIHQPVAWDNISASMALTGSAPAAIIFGTLALRSPANRLALASLLAAFPAAWVVCDLNLRPPFDDLTPLAPLLRHCHLLKFNGEEARRLSGRAADATDWQAMAADLSDRFSGAAICLTLGGEGAALRDGSGWWHAGAPPVVVRDTIGAGDAFTGALVAGRVRHPDLPWPSLLRTSCALGSFVASRDGAQPDYGEFKLMW